MEKKCFIAKKLKWVPVTLFVFSLFVNCEFSKDGPHSFTNITDATDNLSQRSSAAAIFSTGWENGQEYGFVNTLQYYKDVAGIYNSWTPPPECGRRGREYANSVFSGDYSLMVAGYSKANYAYCYYKLFDTNITITSGMRMRYRINHFYGTEKISIDGHFTDGQTMRDFYNNGYLTDQYGQRIHPGQRNDPMGSWYYVEVDLSKAAGKTLDILMAAFDNGNNGFKGSYRAYIDDFSIVAGSSGCPNTPLATRSDIWTWEIWNNRTLSGGTTEQRWEGTSEHFTYNWGNDKPSTCVGNDDFSIRFSRHVNFSQAGDYTFLTTTDDGVRLIIDGNYSKPLIDQWDDQAPRTWFGTIYLPEGYHTINMEYYEHAGGAYAGLEWRFLPKSEHPDINLDIRGYQEFTYTYKNLKDFHPAGSSEIDLMAPQLSTLIEGVSRPPLASFCRTHHWDWENYKRGELISNDNYGSSVPIPLVTVLGLQTTEGQSILVPDSEYDIGEGYEVMILYATADSITLKYTREDNMVFGYGIHLKNFNVDPQIVNLYNSLNAAGRVELPAMYGGQILGTAKAGEILVAVRDTGSFMDPTWENDWWFKPAVTANPNGQLGVIRPTH